jgi:ribosomal protein S18 acetylase RimI-like enzyme
MVFQFNNKLIFREEIKITIPADINGLKIVELRPEQAQQVAELHISGIATGFISSLGINFVRVLYETIAESQSAFGLVAEIKGRIVGFVVFTPNIKKLYKSVICKHGLYFAFLLAGKMFSISRIKKVFETIFYPGRVNNLDVPEAELLSIVVASEERGKGLSSMLTRKGFEQCRQRGIGKIKVLVGAGNKAANALYLKSGFQLAGQMENHGVVSNVYVARTDHFEHR